MGEEKSREQYLAEGKAVMEQYNPIFLWPYFCTINAFRAMLNEVGLNRALEAVRHYNEAWGKTMAGMAKERLGLEGNELEQLAMCGYYGHNCTSLGGIKPLEIYEGGAVCELFVCPNPSMNAPPEMCIAMSHVFSEAMCKFINPEYEVIYTHHMGNGDDSCRWVLKKKESKYTIDDLGRLEKTVPPLGLPMEEMLSFGAEMVMMRQLFTFTSALIDLVGSQRAMELITPLARETGLMLGTQLKGGSADRSDISTIKEKIEALSPMLMTQGSVVKVADEGLEREVTDCPCKGAVPEVCLHIEGVLDGVCKAFNPEYEFVHDRMMSKGDPTCHWTIRKRGGVAVEGNTEKEAPIENPARMLALRFAKGEISHEEFDKSMEILKKHQAVR